jgi:hypothetical protein
MIKPDSTASQSIITYGTAYYHYHNTKNSIRTRKQNPANLAALLGRVATLHIPPGLTLPATSLELPHILCILSLLVSPVVLSLRRMGAFVSTSFSPLLPFFLPFFS